MSLHVHMLFIICFSNVIIFACSLKPVLFKSIYKIKNNGIITKINFCKSSKDKNERIKYTKSNLPSKICLVCGRPFNWRKKWEKVWEEVKYCSDKCRGNRNSNKIFTNDNLIPKSSAYNHKDNIFKTFISLVAVSSLSPLGIAKAKIKYNRPTTEEISTLFNDYDWSNENFKVSDFRRLDESNDGSFYKIPRFVEHIDNLAIQSLTNFHNNVISKFEKRNVDILDLCSSWVSHMTKSSNNLNVVGIGMNIDELNKNPILSQYYVQDLNENYRLNFPNNSFDIVLLQLSIDYLIHPIELLKEVNRILRPNGSIYISFSNRVFIEKAVAVWTGKSDLEHLEIVGKYLHFAGGYKEPVNIYDISPKSGNFENDPLYVVEGIKI